MQPAIASRGAALVVLGPARPEHIAGFRAATGYDGALFVDPSLAAFREAGLAETRRVSSMDEAVRVAHALARSMRKAGDPHATVLLSPAAASFDMFEDYAARGRAFKTAVAALAAGQAKGSR